MIGLKRTSQSNLDPNKITNQVRKSLRVLFPDSNSAGDYDVLVRQTGLLIAPRIGSSVAMTSDFYYKMLAVLEVALWPAVQLQHPLVMQLKSLPNEDWNKSRGFFFPWLVGASKRLRTTEQEEILYARQKGKFKLMSNIEIPLSQHMTINGQTGSGKSYLLEQLLSVFDAVGKVILIDGKLSDGARWAQNHENVELIKPHIDDGSTGSSIGSDLLEAVNDRLNQLEATMYSRQEKLFNQDKISVDYKALNVEPIFLVIDELAALTIGASRQSKQDFFDHLTRLSLLARESGIVLVLSLQQARNDALPTAVRAQMGIKILLGSLDKDNTQFLFPSLDTVPFLPEDGPGKGIISIAGSRKYKGVLPIATPTIKGSDSNG